MKTDYRFNLGYMKTEIEAKPKFIFTVVLWDESGNVKLFRKNIGIRRAKQRSAKDFLIRRYPRPYFVELDSIER